MKAKKGTTGWIDPGAEPNAAPAKYGNSLRVFLAVTKRKGEGEKNHWGRPKNGETGTLWSRTCPDLSPMPVHGAPPKG